MFVRVLGYVVVFSAVNVGLAAWAGLVGPRPFEVLSKDQLSQVRGGDCFYTAQFPCDGVPVSCDNGTDVDPYPGPAGTCSKQNDGSYNCKWATERQYILYTREDSYSDCLPGYAFATKNGPFNFVCYQTQKCPAKCHQINDPVKGLIQICDTGTGVQDAGNHTYSACSTTECQGGS